MDSEPVETDFDSAGMDFELVGTDSGLAEMDSPGMDSPPVGLAQFAVVTA